MASITKEVAQGLEHKNGKFNIEQIFNTVSNRIGSSLVTESFTSSKILRCLTPYSKEACCKNGIDPETLQLRDLDSFSGESPHLQKLLYESYEKRRHELIRIARDERCRLKDKHDNLHSKQKSIMTKEQIVAREAKERSSMIELEERRLAKLKIRKQKEIFSKIQYEAKMQEIQRAMKEKEEHDLLMMERKRRDMERKDAQAAEERRLRELRKKEKKEEEEAKVDLMNQEALKRELESLEERKRKMRRKQIQARIAEEQRQKKIKEQKLKTQQILEDKAKNNEKKLQERKEREIQRQQLLEQRQSKVKALNEMQRKHKEERLKKNRDLAQKIDEEKKEAIIEKSKIADLNHQKALADQNQLKLMKQKKRQMLERKRQMQLKSMRDQKEERKEVLQQKFIAEEINLRQMQSNREEELRLAKQKRELTEQLKRDNVLRIKRAQEYQALQILEKIKFDDARTRETMDKKQEIAMNRKKAAIEARRQKDLLVNLLDKTNTANSIKKIKDILNGNPIQEKRNSKCNQSKLSLAKPNLTNNDHTEMPITLERRLRACVNLNKQTQAGKRYSSPYESV